MKKLIFVSVVLSISLPVIADVSNKEVAKCAAINGDLNRLECYDNIAKRHNLAGLQSVTIKAEGVGKWIVDSSVNPIDDSKTVNLLLVASSGVSRFDKPIVLVARCKSNQTELYINWATYLGREAFVTSRIGTKKANRSEWDLSSDSQATFKRQPISMLKEMLGESKLVAQVTPYNESPSTAVFDITGLDEAIKPLQESCGW